MDITIILPIVSPLSRSKINLNDGRSRSLIGIEALIIGGKAFIRTKLSLGQIYSVVGVSYVLEGREGGWIVFNLRFIRAISLLWLRL
jgi:hypothetical protein